MYSEVESAAIIRLPQVHFITSNGQPASEYGHRTTVIRHFSETSCHLKIIVITIIIEEEEDNANANDNDNDNNNTYND